MRSLNPTTPSSQATITTLSNQQLPIIDRKYSKMAPRRKASAPAAKSQQSTLAFHGTTNRVTKAGVKSQGAKKNILEAKLKDIKPEVADISNTEPTTTEAAIIEQTEQEVKAQEVESTPDEDRARRISDAAIKKYWTAKEKQRLASRAHQGGLSLHDKILREFDMSAHYGVSSESPPIYDMKSSTL